MEMLLSLEYALERFLEGPEAFYWWKDERIFLEGGWAQFDASFREASADLLATQVRTRAEDPAWNWWPSLKFRGGNIDTSKDVAAFLPLARYSRGAAAAVLSGIREGWSGHPEAVVPTLVSAAGLSIEDIGGVGSFTPKERVRRWYDNRTWRWNGPVEYVPHLLHFPVLPYDRPLAPFRVASPQQNPKSPRILFASPVGGAAAQLLQATLRTFVGCGADCLVLQYDDAELNLPQEVRSLKDRGAKWQLAIRHLDPERLADFDYLFYWDDDLDITGFDPLRFVEIMRQNRLDMAQPAIVSPHVLSHAITARHPCPPPRLGPSGIHEFSVVGRLTNFVEIMAPVFSRQGWREFYSYLDPENSSGWGYDYIPLGRKGVVDALPVVHTRPVQSACAKSGAEITRFIASQGLAAHATVNQGALFERLHSA